MMPTFDGIKKNELDRALRKVHGLSVWEAQRVVMAWHRAKQQPPQGVGVEEIVAGAVGGPWAAVGVALTRRFVGRRRAVGG